jgi:uncharacterized protein (TIGR03118 family)
MTNWLRHVFSRNHRLSLRSRRHRASLNLETLEDRSLPSTTFVQTDLVSDQSGVAKFQDTNLVNPWGISFSPTGTFWLSDNNSGLSTLYNSKGSPQSLVVSIPSPGSPLGATGTPDGTVYNSTTGFAVSNGTISKPATFLFATEDGTIVGWNSSVNPSGSDKSKAGTYGIIIVDNSQNPTATDGAVYKGLTIATNSKGVTSLYAANFRSGQIEVYNKDFKLEKLSSGAFTDPNLPSGYAPFNVQDLNGKIYVTYAKQDSSKHDDTPGLGFGFVDVYNLDGTGETRLISKGQLDAPWGLAIAPSSFGTFAGDLLVGNFGNGHIDAYNAGTGKFAGALKDSSGTVIAIDGLWALSIGNGKSAGSTSDIYFTAGPSSETHGLFGSLTAASSSGIDLVAAPTALATTETPLSIQTGTELPPKVSSTTHSAEGSGTAIFTNLYRNGTWAKIQSATDGDPAELLF